MSTQQKKSDRPLVTLDLCGLNCQRRCWREAWSTIAGAGDAVDFGLPGAGRSVRLGGIPATGDRHRQARRPQGGHSIRRGTGAAVRPTANVTLDMSGVSCPGPIIEAKKLLDGMKSGEILLLASNCPGVSDDVGSWIRSTRLELVARQEVRPGNYEFFIRKV